MKPDSRPNRRRFLHQLLGVGMAAELAQVPRARAQDSPSLTIEGYGDTMSCRPGDTVGLCVSTNANTFSVTVNRVGLRPGTFWKATDLPGKEHPVPPDAAMAGCGWPVAVKVPIGRDWPSGLYIAKIQGQSGSNVSEPRDVLIIVRSANPGRTNRILYQIATNTYQAYNEWGGTNLYSGPKFPRVSFDKPFKIYETPLRPGANWYNPNTNSYHTWDEPFIHWLESAGYGIDYCANLDLEFHPEELFAYQMVLSVGHDEYWSAGMRDNLEAFIEKGGNVAFFSGNSICWQVRVGDNGRTLVCYKREHEQDPAFQAGNFRELTSLWAEPLVGRPENFLSGVGFPYGGYNGLHGEFMGNTQGKLDSHGNQPAYIGSFRGAGEFFQGDMDELRIYNTCLTDRQIRQLSRGRRRVSNDSLAAYWRMDGTLENRAPIARDQPEPEPIGSPFEYVKGRAGKALGFNGTDQTVKVNSYPGLKPTTGQITFAAWIRPGAMPEGWFIIYRKEDGNARQLLAIGGPDEQCGVWCGLGLNNHYTEVGGRMERDRLTDGKWHHVAAAYDGTHIRIYHNGAMIHEENTVIDGAGEYTVHRPDHWILEGTGLTKGEKFGAEDGIAGYECDGCEYVWKDGYPVPTGRDGTPRNFEIVALAPARWDLEEGSLGWAHDIRKSYPTRGVLVPEDLEQDGNAALGTYTRNGTVVTVGSCDWSDGLKSGNPIVDRIVRNIMDRLSG